ncbi:MAG TPA: tetratricopeptide repeat protein [Gammaproteobacteria bacterium]
MLTFWANYYASGLDAYAFKLTNLLIHLFNGLALFWLTRLLVSDPHSAIRPNGTDDNRDVIALAVAGLWLLHPLHVTSVLYVVQRMTSLSATFVILGLICYVLGRQRIGRGEPGFPLILLGLVGFGSLATLSKENGALLPLYMATIEVALFRFSGVPAAASKKLKAFFVCTVIVPAVAALLFLIANPGWLAGGYQGRDFTLAERLMTETRILWLYLRWAIVPTPNDLGLFHDDIAVSRTLLEPPTTLLATVGIVAIFGAAFLVRKRAPLFTFATFWFLGGHLLESSVIGLELAYEHRNYLPLYGPLLAGVQLLMHCGARLTPKARLGVPAAFAVGLAVVTFGRALEWSSLHDLRMSMVRHHPNSSRANYEAGVDLATLVLRNPELGPAYYEQVKDYFERSASLSPTAVNGLFGLILLNATNDKPVDEEAIEQLTDRLSSIPLNYTVVEGFRSLVDWMTKKTVVLPEATIVSLFGAALGNATANHRTRASLLSILSSYYCNVAGNLQEAASLALAAVEQDPGEPAHRLYLAELAIKLGNFELAKRELEVAQRYDRLGQFALRIGTLSELLQEARAKS